MILIESISRLIPGVIKESESFENESYSFKKEMKNLEYPQYTRPAIFNANNKDYKVPKVLLSGNHKEINSWRKKKMKRNKKEM